MRHSPCWLVLAVALVARPACGDDGAMSGIGGSIHLLRGHPSVRMVSERVLVRLNGDPEAPHHVVATFVFRNEGPATMVTMGFPESGGGEGGPAFSSFSASVDGEPVRVRKTPWQGCDDHHNRWRTKRVYFAAGQTRVVQDRYTTLASRVSIGERSFQYVLTTGSSWKGTIGAATVVVDTGEVRYCGPLEISPAGYRRRGDQIIWRWRNLDPKRNVHVAWDPYYWWKRLCTGPRMNFAELSRSIGMRAGPRLEGSTLLVPARMLPALLDGGEVRWRGSREAVELVIGAARATIPIPGSTMVVNGRSVRLPVRARIIAGRAMVPLRAVAEALGWRVYQGAPKPRRKFDPPPAIWLEPASRVGGRSRWVDPTPVALCGR